MALTYLLSTNINLSNTDPAQLREDFQGSGFTSIVYGTNDPLINTAAADVIACIDQLAAEVISGELAIMAVEAAVSTVDIAAEIVPYISLSASSVPAQLYAWGGTSGLNHVQAPADLSASVFVGGVVASSLTAAAAGLLAEVIDAGLLRFTVNAQPGQLSSTVLAGTIATAAIQSARSPLQAGVLLGGVAGVSVQSARSLLVAGADQAVVDQVLDLMLQAEPGQLVAWMVPDATGQGYDVSLINLQSFGHGVYSNYPFDCLATDGSVVMAGSAAGLFVCDAVDDEGQEIVGRIEFGSSDFGVPTVKHIPELLVDCQGSGEFRLGLISEDGRDRIYSAEIDHPGLWQNKRIKTAKGISARYWSVMLELPTAIGVASIQPNAATSQRSR